MTIEVRSNEALEPVEAKEPKEQPKSAPVEMTEQKAASESETEETEELDGKSNEESDEESGESEDTDKPRKQGGLERRFKKLTSQKAEALRLAEERAQELEYWKAQAMKNGATEKPNEEPKAESARELAEGEPNPENFETNREYQKALVAWELDQRDAKAKADAEKAKVVEAQQKAWDAHVERVQSFVEKHEDYAELMEDVDHFKDASLALGQEIIESENGPALMYDLAKDKAEYQRLNALPPRALAREIGKLEAKIAARTSEPKEEPKKITKAPKPIAPVGGSKGVIAKSPEEMSQAEYEKWRTKQMKERSQSF